MMWWWWVFLMYLWQPTCVPGTLEEYVRHGDNDPAGFGLEAAGCREPRLPSWWHLL